MSNNSNNDLGFGNCLTCGCAFVRPHGSDVLVCGCTAKPPPSLEYARTLLAFSAACERRGRRR